MTTSDSESQLTSSWKLEESEDLKEWMIDAGFDDILDDTYDKLRHNGFNKMLRIIHCINLCFYGFFALNGKLFVIATIKCYRQDLEACTVNDIKEYSENMDIKIVDRAKLQRVIEKSLSRKLIFDPDEIKIIKFMDYKVKRLEIDIDSLKNKLDELNNKKSEYQIEIIHSFNDLIAALNKRKVKLLKDLDDITQEQSECIKTMINAHKKPLEKIKQIQKETNELMNKPIDITELQNRKQK